MTIRTICAAFVSILALAGCAGMDAAMQYDGIDPVSFDSGDSTWRIFDKPGEGRLMITPTVGDAMAMGAVKGLTWGAVDDDIPKPVYQSAVENWLAKDRRCSVTDGYKILGPQWEFKYHCA